MVIQAKLDQPLLNLLNNGVMVCRIAFSAMDVTVSVMFMGAPGAVVEMGPGVVVMRSVIIVRLAMARGCGSVLVMPVILGR